MLEKIQFINYKCFENATIPLREITIAVGKNNAGKSTMIEGLRLLSLAIKSGSKQSYKDLPSIFQQRNKKSKKLKLDSLKIDLRTVSHFYKEDILMIRIRLKFIFQMMWLMLVIMINREEI